MMERVLLFLTLVLLVVTLGCGFVIRYGGEAFRNAVGGHMVLGVLTLVSMVVLSVVVLRQ